MTIVGVTIEKETKDMKTGIRVSVEGGTPKVMSITPDSLFAQATPQLQPGMEIISINNVNCRGKTASEVTQIIKDAEGQVVVLVDDEIKAVSAVVVSNPQDLGVSRPPNGVEVGGRWGTAKYFGDKTGFYTFILCLVCFPFCCYMACCPQDEKDAYRINNKVYDADGKYMGTPEKTKFVPSRR